MNTDAPVTVRVELDLRGVWKVDSPDRAEPLRCPTLDEARRLAHSCAEDLDPCEIIICDAYHRVLQREPVG